jgi:anti-sigma B factor antagonist
LEFRADLTRRSDRLAVVTVAGEVDLFTAPKFDEMLTRGIDEGSRQVIVDFSEVTFIDSTALSVLVVGGKRLRLDGRELLIVCGLGNVRRLIQIAGLASVFVVYQTLAEALAAVETNSLA